MKSDLFLDFLEAAFHHILYLRRVYPEGVFKQFKKFRVPVGRAEHPWIQSYIAEHVEAIRDLGINNVHRIDMVISIRSKEVESFALELGNSDLSSKASFQDINDAEESFRAMILRLGAEVCDIPVPDHDESSTFSFKIHSKKEYVDQVSKWCLASTTPTPGSKSLTPIFGMSKPFCLQLFMLS